MDKSVVFEYLYQNNNNFNLKEVNKKKNRYYLDIFQTFDSSTKLITHHSKFGLGMEFQLEENELKKSYNRIENISFNDIYGCGIVLNKSILNKLKRGHLYLIEIEGTNIPEEEKHTFEILHKYPNNTINPILNIEKELFNSPQKNTFEFLLPSDYTSNSEIILLFYNSNLNEQIFSTFYLFNIKMYINKNIKSILLFQGKQGIPGEQGIRGLIGPPGNKGESGNKGDKGDSIIGPQGPEGIMGKCGNTPQHQWHNNKIRFQNEDGSWGDFNTIIKDNECYLSVFENEEKNIEGKLNIIKENNDYNLYLIHNNIEKKIRLNITEQDFNNKIEDLLQKKPLKDKSLFQGYFNNSNILLYPHYNNTYLENITIKWDNYQFNNSLIDVNDDGIITINNNDMYIINSEIWVQCQRDDGKKTQLTFELSVYLQKRNNSQWINLNLYDYGELCIVNTNDIWGVIRLNQIIENSSHDQYRLVIKTDPFKKNPKNLKVILNHGKIEVTTILIVPVSLSNSTELTVIESEGT